MVTVYHSFVNIILYCILKRHVIEVTMARKNLSTRIENDLQKSIKILAINLEKPLNDLLEEAIRDLLKKYEKQEKKAFIKQPHI